MPEINGFKIGKYNIHNIPEGVKYHTCPECSSARKKKTQKCLSVFWDTGMASCAHCGAVIQLHEWKKNKEDVDYIIPEWKNSTKLSEKLVKWFENRGISQFVLRLMKVSEGVEAMPHKSEWKQKNTVQFPYYRYSEIINIKYRGGDKTFKLYKGAEKIAYNIDRAIGQEAIYCVEGEIDVLSVMECGIFNVISPPNGFTKNGNVNLDWLNNDVEHFINAKKLILCFDNDIPGENGKREFIRRFGAHKCYVVDLKGEKDANDYLIKHGSEKLRKTLETHIEIPLENVSTYNDFKEDVRDFFLNGMPKGYISGSLVNLDANFSVNTSHIVLVTGIPSCFTKERLIHTKKGVKKISKLGVGDEVLSYSHHKKINEYKKVINILINDKHKGKLYKIKLKNGTEIKVTDNHRFWTGTQYMQIKEILLYLHNKKKYD